MPGFGAVIALVALLTAIVVYRDGEQDGDQSERQTRATSGTGVGDNPKFSDRYGVDETDNRMLEEMSKD